MDNWMKKRAFSTW
jgi:hypothetical protein